jgi:hypothetical protein
MNTYTYDASLVSVTIDGRYMVDHGEGDFVSWEKDEDNIDVKVSANGTTGITKRNNKLGTITYKPMQGSPEVSFLNKLANTFEQFPIWVNSGGDNPEIVGGTQAMVLKPADGSLEDEASDREFEIKVFDYTVK